jgi:hypothetical protein
MHASMRAMQLHAGEEDGKMHSRAQRVLQDAAWYRGWVGRGYGGPCRSPTVGRIIHLL